MKIKDFFNECHEKEVFKNLSIYLVSSWLLLQVLSVLREPFGLPKLAMTYLLLVLLIGFPFYVYLIWKFRLKPLKDHGMEEASGARPRKASAKSAIELNKKNSKTILGFRFRSNFQRMYFTFLLVISMIALLSASLIVRANFVEPGETAVAGIPLLNTPEEGNKIAVLKFENNTLNDKLDVVGKMAVDWIMHGITQNKVGQVISPKIIEDYSSVMLASKNTAGDQGILKDYLKPSKIINGTYYLSKGSLLVQCSIVDNTMSKTLISFEPVTCDPNAPLDCIEALKQRILGYLVMENESEIGFEETPPNFEAYQLLLEAHTKYSNIDPEYLTLLNEAIAIDPNYFEPKVDRIEYYYNQDQFAVADSLHHLLAKETSNNKRQMNLLNFYDALLKGNNRNAYTYFKEEYNIEPFNLENNSGAMVLAMQFVNKPEDVEGIYNALSMKDMDFQKCRSCEFRNYIMALAYIELKEMDKAIELLEPFSRLKGNEWVKEALLRAYVVNGNKNAVDDLLASIKLNNTSERWHAFTLFSGKEFFIQGKSDFASLYYNQVIKSLEENWNSISDEERELLPLAYYYLGNYRKAEQLYEALYEKSDAINYLPYLAIASMKLGASEKAQRYLSKLDASRTNFQFGWVDYGMAQYYAAAGNEKEAMDYLLKAVASGKRYTPSAFQYDIHFQPYIQTQIFDRVMKFWQ